MMREEAQDNRSDMGPRQALMHYVDDQPDQENTAATTGTSGVAGSENGGGRGSGLPQVA